MITGLLLSILVAFISGILTLLPQAEFSASITTGINSFFANAWAYNGFFPIDTMFTLLIASAGFLGFVILWDILKWLAHYVRGN